MLALLAFLITIACASSDASSPKKEGAIDIFQITHDELRQKFKDKRDMVQVCEALKDNLSGEKKKVKLQDQEIDRIFQQCLDYELVEIPQDWKMNEDKYSQFLKKAAEGASSSSKRSEKEKFDIFQATHDDVKKKLTADPDLVRVCKDLLENLAKTENQKRAKLPDQDIDRIWQQCLDYEFVSPPEGFKVNQDTYSKFVGSKGNATETSGSEGGSNASSTTQGGGGGIDIFQITHDELKQKFKDKRDMVQVCEALKDNLSGEKKKAKLQDQEIDRIFQHCLDYELVEVPQGWKMNEDKYSQFLKKATGGASSPSSSKRSEKEKFDIFQATHDDVKKKLTADPDMVRVCKDLHENLANKENRKKAKLPDQDIDGIWQQCLDYEFVKPPEGFKVNQDTYSKFVGATETSGKKFDIFKITDEELTQKLQGSKVIMEVCQSLLDNLNKFSPQKPKLKAEYIDDIWGHCVDFKLIELPRKFQNKVYSKLVIVDRA